MNECIRRWSCAQAEERRASERPMAAHEGSWTTRLEEFLDEGDKQGAKQLLENIISKLEGRDEAATDLTLAAALNDLAALYNSEGLSLKADSLTNSALLIKNRAQNSSGLPNHRVGLSSKEPAEAKELSCESQKRAGEPSTSGFNREEDWEKLLCEGMLKLDLPGGKTSDCLLKEKNIPKQRGRGAFTFGGMGMYSDRLNASSLTDSDKEDRIPGESENEEITMGAHSKVTYGVRHVLVISFPPKITIKDLEELFEPFSSHGVAIRWINDITALAVFRNPDTARNALQWIQNPQFKLRELSEDSELWGLFSEKDLEPPIPRPASSSHAAQRMIMSALQKQGINNKARPKDKFQSLQKQEDERRQRLVTRQKLRDEAWGPDG